MSGEQAEKQSEILTVWWWSHDMQDIPVPYERRKPAAEALAFARSISDGRCCAWVKVFGSSEDDIRYRWGAILTPAPGRAHCERCGDPDFVGIWPNDGLPGHEILVCESCLRSLDDAEASSWDEP